MEKGQKLKEPSSEEKVEVSVHSGGVETVTKYPTCVKRNAKRLGISNAKVQKSYNRGIGAWKNNPGSVRNVRGVKGGPGKKMSKQQWACARVNKLRRGGNYDQDLLR